MSNATRTRRTRLSIAALAIAAAAAPFAPRPIAAQTANASATNAPATDAPARAWSFRIASGSLIGTGDADRLKNANVTTAQLGRRITPHIALTGSVSWARSRDLTTAAQHKLDVFNTDLGVEARSTEWQHTRGLSLSGFTGMGGGLRSYAGRTAATDGSNHPAGYIAIGGDIGIRRIGVRLETRGYATRFAALTLPVGVLRSTTHHRDVVVMGALYFKSRRAVAAQP